MRILYLSACGQMGGAEMSLLELLACIRIAEPDWELILLVAEDGPLVALAEQRGVRVIVESFPSSIAQTGDTGLSGVRVWFAAVRAAGAASIYARRLARLVRSIRPDIIHTNGFKMHLLGTLTSPKTTQVIWHVHDYISRRSVMRRLLYWQRRRCSLAIANSESVAADARLALPGLKVVRIYNAVDLDQFSLTGPTLDLDKISGLPPPPSGAVRVGLVSTFARWKGQREFLHALRRLDGAVNVRGYIIGGPIYQTSGSQYTLAELQAEVERLGLAGKVGLTGFINNCAAAMRSLDVVIHASTAPEPFGMVIIQGMACGRPVVASMAGGASELIKDGENALGHRPGDVEQLAEQIAGLASDPDLRIRLGKAGRAAVEQLYNSRQLAQQVTAVYHNISGSKIDGGSAPHPAGVQPLAGK